MTSANVGISLRGGMKQKGRFWTKGMNGGALFLIKNICAMANMFFFPGKGVWPLPPLGFTHRKPINPRWLSMMPPIDRGGSLK